MPTCSISLVIHRLCLSHERLNSVLLQFLLPLAEKTNWVQSLVQLLSQVTCLLLELPSQVSRITFGWLDWATMSSLVRFPALLGNLTLSSLAVVSFFSLPLLLLGLAFSAPQELFTALLNTHPHTGEVMLVEI